MPLSLAIAGAVQCVVSPVGSASVRDTTSASNAAGSGGMRGGRVLSRSRPATHALVYALGNPVGFFLTCGEVDDLVGAYRLLHAASSPPSSLSQPSFSSTEDRF
jgi:hypothetical protein